MSDTTVCSNCHASVPAAAAFCTSCGSPMAASAGGAETGAGGFGADDTRVDLPRTDATQVFPAAEAARAEPPPSPSAPWSPTGPSSGGSQAPWNPPPSAPAPAWQQPPPGPSYGAPPPSAPPAWGPPPGQNPAWGATAQAPAKDKTGSPLGGIAALLGAALTLVGIFTTWVATKGGGKGLSGWDLTSGNEFLKSKDPYILLVLAIVAIAIGIARFTGKLHSIARIAAIVVGIAIVAILVRDWLSIVDVVKNTLPSTTKVEQKFGYFLAVAGGIVTAVSGLLPGAKPNGNR